MTPLVAQKHLKGAMPAPCLTPLRPRSTLSALQPKNLNKLIPTDASTNCFRKVSSLWGDHVYDKEKLIQGWQENHDKYWKARNDQTFSESKALSHKTGLYSSMFLSQSRLSPDFPGLYREIIYNPYLDKGTGEQGVDRLVH